MCTKKESHDLLNEATRPVAYSKRTVGQFNLSMIWFGFAVQLIIFMLAGQLYPSCSVMEILIALILGNTVPAIVIYFTQELGVKYGLSYGTLVRVMFGIKGGILPGWLRAVPAIFWFGFQTWLCAGAVDAVCIMTVSYTHLDVYKRQRPGLLWSWSQSDISLRHAPGELFRQQSAR